MENLPVVFVHVILLCLCLCLPGSCGDENFVFSGFADAGNLTLDGAAKVTAEGLLELTNNTETITGHAFHPTPLRFKESPNGTARSFSATFVFAVVAAGAGYPDVTATDGMAFLVSPSTDFSDVTSSQYLGFLGSTAVNHTFAVELDTYQNAELRDIDGNHVGVHNGSLYSVTSQAARFHDGNDGTVKSLSLDSDMAMQVWVDYDGKGKQVNVTLAPMGLAKPSTPLISTVSDLSTVLTELAYVGFSAAAGPVKTKHNVLAWSFAMDGPTPPIDFKKLPKLPYDNDSKTLPKEALMIALPVASLILAACMAAILLWRRRFAYAEVREDWEVDHPYKYKGMRS